MVTDTTLAGAFHERIHQWLPGIEEVRQAAPVSPEPVLVVSSSGAYVQTARDREEEVAAFARWVRATSRAGDALMLDRMALVVRQRLPYVYLATDVFRSAGIPCQMFDALPLAAEPYAAALDVVFSFVSANFARVPAIALLRSPHFTFPARDTDSLRAGDVDALDREAQRSGLSRRSRDARTPRPVMAERRVACAGRCAGPALCYAGSREACTSRRAEVAMHLDRLLAFLTARQPGGADRTSFLRAGQLRARAAVHALLRALRDAYVRSTAIAEFDEIAAMVRREVRRTFAPRSGDSGVHLVDASAASAGSLRAAGGLVDGEWPDRPRRNIAYSPAILRDLAGRPMRIGSKAPAHLSWISCVCLRNSSSRRRSRSSSIPSSDLRHSWTKSTTFSTV